MAKKAPSNSSAGVPGSRKPLGKQAIGFQSTPQVDIAWDPYSGHHLASKDESPKSVRYDKDYWTIRTPSGRVHRVSWYEKARYIRRDPTVALGRGLICAPMIVAGWTVEGEDKRAIRLIEKALLPYKTDIMRTASKASIDYGWQAWEVRPYKKVDGIWHIRYKSLRHEITDVIVGPDGLPVGVRNYASYNPLGITMGEAGDPTYVDIRFPYCAIASSEDEYDSPYGWAKLKNVDLTLDRYDIAENAAFRYGNKQAGSHWVVHFPVGTTPKIINGQKVLVDNSTIADEILGMIGSNSLIKLPVQERSIKKQLERETAENVRTSAWQIERITDSGGMDPFLERERYLDVLKLRGLLLPEQTAIAGFQGGNTGAEARIQADVALMSVQDWGGDLVDWINSEYGFVGSILAFNDVEWYPGRVYIKPASLTAADKTFMRELLRTVLNNVGSYEGLVDFEQMGRRADVPLMKGANEALGKHAEQKRQDEMQKAQLAAQSKADSQESGSTPLRNRKSDGTRKKNPPSSGKNTSKNRTKTTGERPRPSEG